jgi:3-dehydroquinate dehydratase
LKTPTQCSRCGKFAKEIKIWEEGRDTCRILYCNHCGAYTYTSISYYLEVSGEMMPTIENHEIISDTEERNEYICGAVYGRHPQLDPTVYMPAP